MHVRRQRDLPARDGPDRATRARARSTARPGLSCQLDGTAIDGNGQLAASCTPELSGAPSGDNCGSDTDCRNGTCALGHCVDLCRDSRDCADGDACMQVPRVEASTPTSSALFGGCLPSHGVLQWSIPVVSPAATIYLPVPSAARSVTLSMAIDGVGEVVGASAVRAPTGAPLFTLGDALVTAPDAAFYAQPVRHQVLLAPPSPCFVDADAGRRPVQSRARTWTCSRLAARRSAPNGRR